jgi:hypothetical protein
MFIFLYSQKYLCYGGILTRGSLHLSRQTCLGRDSNTGRLLGSTLEKRPPHGSPQCITLALHHDVGRKAHRVFTWEVSRGHHYGGTWPGFTPSSTRARETDMPRPGCEPWPLTQQARTLAKSYQA